MLVLLAPGSSCPLVGHDGLLVKNSTTSRSPSQRTHTRKSPVSPKVVHCPALGIFTLLSRNKPAAQAPYLLGCIGVPHPAQKKFWATTAMSLLRTENRNCYTFQCWSRQHCSLIEMQLTMWCAPWLGVLNPVTFFILRKFYIYPIWPSS